jgi:hypothetical protein
MPVIDEITAHDGTVTAITEEEMTGGKETIGETKLGETVAGIVIAGMKIAEGVRRTLTSDDTLQSLPVIHPMVPRAPEGRLIQIGKRASEYYSPQHIGYSWL